MTDLEFEVQHQACSPGFSGSLTFGLFFFSVNLPKTTGVFSECKLGKGFPQLLGAFIVFWNCGKQVFTSKQQGRPEKVDMGHFWTPAGWAICHCTCFSGAASVKDLSWVIFISILHRTRILCKYQTKVIVEHDYSQTKPFCSQATRC